MEKHYNTNAKQKRETYDFSKRKSTEGERWFIVELDSGVCQLVCWCFETNQPQMIASGLKSNFSLSPTYSFHKSLYHKSFFLFFLKPQLKFYPQFRNARPEKQTHVLEPVYIPQALNTGTCIQQSKLFYFAGLHRNRC